MGTIRLDKSSITLSRLQLLLLIKAAQSPPSVHHFDHSEHPTPNAAGENLIYKHKHFDSSINTRNHTLYTQISGCVSACGVSLFVCDVADLIRHGV